MGATCVWPPDPAAQRTLAAHAAETLRAGGLVVFPTDTVYGLGADPSNPSAIRRIYEVKGRPDEKAIVWLVESIEAARRLGRIGAEAERLAARFWPGPLTLVLARHSPPAGSLPTLGVRVPAHGVALAIVRAAGGVVATTSANRSGEPSARTAGEAAAQIGDAVDLIIDSGPSPGAVESTVVDCSSDLPRILRVGALTPMQVAETLGVSLSGVWIPLPLGE